MERGSASATENDKVEARGVLARVLARVLPWWLQRVWYEHDDVWMSDKWVDQQQRRGRHDRWWE